MADFDADGRPDLLVAQAGDRTRLFHNRRAAPALRVKLTGTGDNPQGIGSVLRPVTPAGPGPAQVVSAGSCYWSQNSTTLLLPQSTTTVRVRWPGGSTAEHPVPPGATTLSLHQTPAPPGK